MKASFPQFSLSPKDLRAGLACCLAALMCGLVAPRLGAQTSDFNTGSAPGWAPYTLQAYGTATFSFPPDDTGGKAYKIYAPPTGDDPYKMRNARAGSIRTNVVYTGRFSAGIDMLAWNDVWHQETGILFYVTDVGPGATDGYAATYSSGYRNLYITVIENEADVRTVGVLEGIVLDPTHHYRLVVSSHDGYTFVLQFFDKVDLANPWCSVICQDYPLTYDHGFCALFVWERTYPSSVEGAEATFDNYAASVPASMPAVVTDLSPQPGGKSTDVYPTVTAVILDRDTYVDFYSIKLRMDGVLVAEDDPNLTMDPFVHKDDNRTYKEFYGATVTYKVTTLLPWGSKHTNSIEFADSAGTSYTNSWVWTTAYPFLPATGSLPVGALNVRGFDFRMAQSDNNCVNLDNSLARARMQLATPPQIPVDRTASGIVQVLGWDKTADPSTRTNVPGLCASSTQLACGEYRNIAVECVAYLELTAGLHRFHINTDDRSGVYSGLDAGDTGALVWWENPGDTANSTFDIVVEAAGLYPVRCLWEETGGGAQLYLNSVNLEDDTDTLINDPTNPAGVVKAWYPLVCRSAASVAGPYAADSTAVNVVTEADVVGADCAPTVVARKITGGTFTVPVSGATRFYCLEGPRLTTISKFTKTASNVAIEYTLQ